MGYNQGHTVPKCQTVFEPKSWAPSQTVLLWGLSLADMGQALPMVERMASCSEEREQECSQAQAGPEQGNRGQTLGQST